MALETVANIVADIEGIYASLSDSPSKWGMRSAVSILNELAGTLNRLYRPTVSLTVTDATDANLTAFYSSSGEGAAIGLKEVFRVGGAGDTTDNALATAKGSAVVANDVFVRDAAATAVFLGNFAEGVDPFTLSGETVTDFINL